MQLLKSAKFFFIISFLFVAACGSTSDKYQETEKEFCKNNKLKDQYIAHWYDSPASLVITEDIQIFLQENKDKLSFIEPNYSLHLQRQAKTVKIKRPLSAYKILSEIGALRAWRKGYEGRGILVAIIDSGIDISNRKLSSNLFVNPGDSTFNQIDDDGNGYVDDVSGWNFTTESGVIKDEIGHGTSIAGIITGRNMDGESLGIAPDVQILPIDIMSGENGNEFDAKKAVEYALQMKANVINNSWSITCSYYLASAFEPYGNENVIFVNAAGNTPIDVWENKIMLSSMGLANFLNVGSTDLFGSLSSFSGFGRTVNMWAPGEQVPVLTVENPHHASAKASGTSISAAVVSGAAAVVWSAHPNESAVQIVQRLKKGAVTLRGQKFIAIDRAL